MNIGGSAGYYPDRDLYSSRFNKKKTSEGVGFAFPDVAKKNMTLDQYKRYINDRISRMSQYASLFSDISDEGYESMKNDPDYEKRVLDSIQAAVSDFESSGGNIVTILHIGATEDESYSERIDLLTKEMENDEEDETWWDKRMKLMLENIRLNSAIKQKRTREQNEITKEMIFAERLNSAERQEEILKNGESAGRTINRSRVYAKAAIAAYRSNLLTQNNHAI